MALCGNESCASTRKGLQKKTLYKPERMFLCREDLQKHVTPLIHMKPSPYAYTRLPSVVLLVKTLFYSMPASICPASQQM